MKHRTAESSAGNGSFLVHPVGGLVEEVYQCDGEDCDERDQDKHSHRDGSNLVIKEANLQASGRTQADVLGEVWGAGLGCLYLGRTRHVMVSVLQWAWIVGLEGHVYLNLILSSYYKDTFEH